MLSISVENYAKNLRNMLLIRAISLQVFICTGTNHYRKPSPLMWEYLNESCNQSVVVSCDFFPLFFLQFFRLKMRESRMLTLENCVEIISRNSVFK